MRKASTENRLSEQKIHSLSCIKDIIRLPRSQRHTRLYHSTFFSKKNPKYRNNHNVHCCDKSCFSDRCIHDPKLLQITCNTEKHTAGNTANEKCLPLFAIHFFCSFRVAFSIYLSQRAMHGSSTTPPMMLRITLNVNGPT